MAAPRGTDEHVKRSRLRWIKRRWRRGRSRRSGSGGATMPMSHRDLWKKIRRETKGKAPTEEIRILERYLADWPEFKGPYQDMRKKYERRIAELRRVLDVQASRHGSRDPFAVKKRGLAEVALVGLPNSGKSTLMRSLTGVDAEIADYPYTTLTPNVGMLNLGNVSFEIVDLPPLPEGDLSDVNYAAGLKEAILNATILALVVDVTADPEQALHAIRERLAEIGVKPALEGDAPGVRDRQEGGGNEPRLGPRETMVFGTKCDLAGGALKSLSALVPGASVLGHPLAKDGRERAVEGLCRLIGRTVVVARDPGAREEPAAYAVSDGATVLDLADQIHHDLAARARKAKIWGASAKYPGQEVGLEHVLAPGDVVEIY
jgi:ribosome-interacting GTPase 1